MTRSPKRPSYIPVEGPYGFCNMSNGTIHQNFGQSKFTNQCYRLEQFDLNIIFEDSKNPSTPTFQTD
ncbi:unnamed protein product [Parnassius mnemosyne]|uniref:Uncharacterized protein n=1 Tax=Parnassius mnemosyne TaxID=213953 RepID=A0AAV1M8S4_9NEOP